MDTKKLKEQIRKIISNKSNILDKYRGSKFSLELAKEINILIIIIDKLDEYSLFEYYKEKKENEIKQLEDEIKEIKDKYEKRIEELELDLELEKNSYNYLSEDYNKLKDKFSYRDEADTERDNLLKNMSSWLKQKKKLSKET